MSDQPGIAPRSVLVVTPDELAAVDDAAKKRDLAQQAEIKRLSDRLAALEAAPPPPVQPPIEPPVEPPVEPPIAPPPGPSLTKVAERVVILDYSNTTTLQRATELARASCAIVGLGISKGHTAMRNFVRAIHDVNPSTKVFQYAIVGETKNPCEQDHDKRPQYDEVEANGWWLRTAGGAGITQSGYPGTRDVNVTDAVKPNAGGERWPQAKARLDASRIPKDCFDGIFLDNCYAKTRQAADFDLNGTDEPIGDETASAAQRAGLAAFIEALRARYGSLSVVGNSVGKGADLALNTPEYREIEYAFLEWRLGHHSSPEGWGGWTTMMTGYRGALSHRPGKAILTCSAAPGDYQLMRYGLASAFVEDGLYCLHNSGNYSAALLWPDEFDVGLGAATEPAKAFSGGLLRRYQGGMVVVNTSKPAGTDKLGPSVTVDLTAYNVRAFSGTQDPKINDGQPVTRLTLAPRDGRVLVLAR